MVTEEQGSTTSRVSQPKKYRGHTIDRRPLFGRRVITLHGMNWEKLMLKQEPPEDVELSDGIILVNLRESKMCTTHPGGKLLVSCGN